MRCGVESEDQGRPSHFPWLFLGRSFDLFLRKAAETQGIESWCLAVAGDGARGLSRAPPATKVVGRMGPRPLHALLHPCSCQEGGGQVGREEAAESSESSLGQPALLPLWVVFF